MEILAKKFQDEFLFPHVDPSFDNCLETADQSDLCFRTTSTTSTSFDQTTKSSKPKPRCRSLVDKSLLKLEDGSLYKGGLKGVKRNGHGVQLCPDGSAFEGNWKDDMKHGDGISYDIDPDGEINSSIKGNWKFDDISGEVTIIELEKDVFKGKINYQHRIGIFEDSKGKITYGKRYNNSFFGYIIRMNKDGEVTYGISKDKQWQGTVITQARNEEYVSTKIKKSSKWRSLKGQSWRQCDEASYTERGGSGTQYIHSYEPPNAAVEILDGKYEIQFTDRKNIFYLDGRCEK